MNSSDIVLTQEKSAPQKDFEALQSKGKTEPGGEVDIIKKELMKFNSEETNILPKNSNWDIKKLLEPKMEKLQRRTQRAIIEFLRAKVAEEGSSSSDDDNNES